MLAKAEQKRAPFCKLDGYKDWVVQAFKPRDAKGCHVIASTSNPDKTH